MIRKLKIKFIILSMTSLLVLLTVIVAGMNVLNYTSITAEVDDILIFLSKNKGTFPDFGGGPMGNPGNQLPPHMSPELPYETRYFSVVLGEDGTVLHVDINRIKAVDRQTAIAYAQSAVSKQNETGFENAFRYLKSYEERTVRITFLDCGRRMDSFDRFLWTSILIALSGFAIVFFVICFFAGKIVRPIAESYEKQKRFITDAGHEIKTPLTIINANIDLLEMDVGMSESLTDIRQQTMRLSSLTSDLVYLARMEEADHKLPMIEFPLSEVVSEAALAFKAPALAQEKNFSCDIEDMLSMRGNDKAITQLVSIIMDNAMKYSPTGGDISLSLTKQNRVVNLTVVNTTTEAIARDALDHVFDRFYRTDPSRNSATGGHGIGLSLAHAIVSAHGGKIHAWTKDGACFGITATLPIQ
ncbi:MAG: HAMP domain-containing histidine kinase [Clostridia bacterium]|nr:HAMP domain-containing histidine kinase [Clostridia bacterium]